MRPLSYISLAYFIVKRYLSSSILLTKPICYVALVAAIFTGSVAIHLKGPVAVRTFVLVHCFLIKNFPVGVPPLVFALDAAKALRGFRVINWLEAAVADTSFAKRVSSAV